MHETVFAKQIIDQAEAQGKVHGVTLEIGELAHVPGDELVECIKRLRPSWTIEWKERPAHVSCSCGYAGHPTVLERGHDSFLIECPECSEVPDLRDGTQIKLVKVSVA